MTALRPQLRQNTTVRALSLAACVLAAAVPMSYVGLSSMKASAATGSVGGSVFRDFDQNGLMGSAEPPMADVWVRAIGQESGPDKIVNTADDVYTPYGPVKTDLTGRWTIPGITSDGNVRVDFLGLDLNKNNVLDGLTELDLPAWLKSAPSGGDNGSSVQFVPLGTSTVKYAVANPSDYVGPGDAQLATTIFLNGDPFQGDGEKTLQLFNNSGSAGTVLADGPEMGSAYGVAVQRSRERIFASAYVKRHAGLWNDKIGKIFMATASTAAAPFVDLASIGMNLGAVDTNAVRGLSTKMSPSADGDTFGKVGKTGIGDIEMGEDDATLWLTNLFDGSLYRIALPANGSAPASGDVTNVGMAPISCSNGTLRPMGLNAHDGKIFVGTVCDASSGTAADLTASVAAYDVAAGTWSTFYGPIALNYTKGCTRGGAGAPQCRWNPWTDTYSIPDMESSSGGWVISSYPMPLLSDIAFDNDGSMVLGFRDRFGDMIGHRNNRPDGSFPPSNGVTGTSGGDILRLCNVSGTLVLEGNVGCASNDANNQGPGGGEFYPTENFGGSFHEETAYGSVVILPGQPDVIASIMDPVNLDAGGISWFSNVTGAQTNELELYRDGGSPSPSTFGKSNGIGDIEALLAPAPIEIGNRVWIDSDNNGRQDPSELPIGGVFVELVDGVTVVGSTTTDSLTGEYYFNNSNVPGGLLPNHAYSIYIDTNQSVLSGYTATPANAPGVSDSVDSDGVVSTGYVSAAVTTGAPGANDHSIDFGFIPSTYDLALVKVVEGTPVAGSDVTWTIRVKNQGTVDSAGFIVNDRVPSAFSFVSASDGGTAVGELVTWNISGLSAGATKDLTLTASIPSNASGAFTNWAEISADSGADIDSTPDSNTGDDSVSPNDNVVDRTALADVATDLGPSDEDDNDFASFTLAAPTTTTSTTTSTTTTSTTTTLAPTTTTTTLAPTTTTTTLAPTSTTTTTTTTLAPTTTTTTVGPTTTTTTTLAPTFSVGNLVWIDTNDNGTVDGAEVGLNNVTVHLLDGSGSIVSTQTTSSGGHYLFTGLAAGAYRVAVIPPAGYLSSTGTPGSLTGPYEAAPGVDATRTDNDDNGTATAPTPGAPIRSSAFVLGTSEPVGEPATPGHTDGTPDSNGDYTVDFGLFPAASIGDLVWHDDNQDGIQDSGETGVAGVTVRLLNANGAVIGTATTDVNGNYLFDNLVPGVYYSVEFVKSTLPNGFVFTKLGEGVESTDSNANLLTGRTKNYLLAPREINSGVDAGIYRPSAITTTSTSTSTTVAPATTTTTVAPTTTGPTSTASTTTVSTTTIQTTASTTTAPISTVQTTSVQTTTAPAPTTTTVISNANPTTTIFTTVISVPAPSVTGVPSTVAPVTSAPGRSSTLSSTVPSTTPVQGVLGTPSPVTTTPGSFPNSAAVTTLPLGSPQNPTTAPSGPTGSIGDRVWKDSNGDGRQDPTERGVANAVVILTMPDGATLRAATDENGNYLFEGLPAGEYSVEILATSKSTNGTNKRNVSLSSGQSYLDADFGFTTVGVRGIQFESETNLAFTGANTLYLVAIALVLGGLGGQIMVSRRRRKS